MSEAAVVESDRVGLLAGVAGIAALGGMAAVGAARNIARKSVVGRPDPHADVDLTALYRERGTTVTADDGLDLAVRIVDLGTVSEGSVPDLTIVFVHGFSLRLSSWHFQREQLAAEWHDRNYRLVFFDHRGHGESDPAPTETCTIAQLADDAAAVIRATVPVGPVVLVGHSMGGMTLMGLARRHLGQLMVWALITATVGMILRMLQERAGAIGRLQPVMPGNPVEAST